MRGKRRQRQRGNLPRRTPNKRKGSSSRAPIAFFLAVFSSVFLARWLLDVQQEYHLLGPESSSGSIGDTRIANKDTSDHQKKYAAVDCPSQIATRNATGYSDPNNGMDESPKRLTITDPSFWISLHKEYFDRMRWASIMKNGNYYETGITDQFQQILAHTTRPGLVLDIGMNIGWFTLWARAHGHRVAAFEPNPIMHTRVCESLELNQWRDDSSVQIFPYGLGKEPATLNLTTGNNPGASSFHEDRLALRFRKKIEVKVVTLDDIALQEGWLDESKPPIYLMKVDVEGFEPNVFGGGKQLLESGRVENIIMENSVTDLRESTDLLATVYQAGYKAKWISTVNGDPYHPEMLPQIDKALEKSSVGMDLEGIGEEFEFLAKVTCNIWWTKR